MRITFIGYGQVGGPLADHLQRLGHEVILAAADPNSRNLQKALVKKINRVQSRSARPGWGCGRSWPPTIPRRRRLFLAGCPWSGRGSGILPGDKSGVLERKRPG